MSRFLVPVLAVLLAGTSARPVAAQFDPITLSIIGLGLLSSNSNKAQDAAREHVCLAQDHINARNYPRALAEADAAVKIHPSRDAYVLRALCRIRAKTYSSALYDLQHANQLTPNDPAVIALTGHVYRLTGNERGVRSAIAALNGLRPRNMDEARAIQSAIDHLASAPPSTHAKRNQATAKAGRRSAALVSL